MFTSLEELVRSYAARSEKPGSPYYSELVRIVLSTLARQGYEAESEYERRSMAPKIRRLIREQQQLWLSASQAKAKGFSEELAEDLAQDAWVDRLEIRQWGRPQGRIDRWSTKKKAMTSPITAPKAIWDAGLEPPSTAPVNDSALLEYVKEWGDPERDPAALVDVREAFSRLPQETQQDLRTFFIEQEPVGEYCRRTGLNPLEANERRDRALELLRKEFHADG